MPFSKENLKFTSLLIGVVLVVITSTVGVVQLSINPNPSPSLYTIVTGLPSIMIMQLLAMMRHEQRIKQQRSETRHDVRAELQPVLLRAEETDRKVDATHVAATTCLTRADVVAIVEETMKRVAK